MRKLILFVGALAILFTLSAGAFAEEETKTTGPKDQICAEGACTHTHQYTDQDTDTFSDNNNEPVYNVGVAADIYLAENVYLTPALDYRLGESSKLDWDNATVSARLTFVFGK